MENCLIQEANMMPDSIYFISSFPQSDGSYAAALSRGGGKAPALGSGQAEKPAAPEKENSRQA